MMYASAVQKHYSALITVNSGSQGCRFRGLIYSMVIQYFAAVHIKSRIRFNLYCTAFRHILVRVWESRIIIVLKQLTAVHIHCRTAFQMHRTAIVTIKDRAAGRLTIGNIAAVHIYVRAGLCVYTAATVFAVSSLDRSVTAG